MKIAIVYDCLFPKTVGGAERWYRSLAERLQRAHEVTYVTRRQWGEEGPETPFETVAVSPGGNLYAPGGHRRIWPPLRFGVGVFFHLLRNGRGYDAVHMASFPYFSVIGAWTGLKLTRSKARLVVDWHEIWGREYWRSYLGALRGRIGFAVQALCVRLPDQGFAFSELVRRRVKELGHHAPVTRLTGEYEPDEAVRRRLTAGEPPPLPLAIAAGRHIREKRVAEIPAAIAVARRTVPELRCIILGDGPESEATRRAIREHGLEQEIEMTGSVRPEEVMERMAAASCLVHPSEREGYGMVVLEAVSLGTPAIVVEGPENAAVELIEPGVNGFISASPGAETLGAALVEAVGAGARLRESTLDWYERHADELSIESSLGVVEASYAAR